MPSIPSAPPGPWRGRNAAKDVLREQIWSALIDADAVFADPHDAIPDFKGAGAAAARLATLPFWAAAQVVKCTPDACQQPIRLRALQDGKVLYMAYPRLAVYPCFLRLTAAELTAAGADLGTASTMDGAIAHGVPVPFEEMAHIDVVNVGSVAVTRNGGRTGKGAGFADLELALLREHGVVDDRTVVVGTVHPLSIVADDAITMTATDSPLHWVVTADEAVATHTGYPAPEGVDWSLVQPDQLDTIPILAELHRRRSAEQ